MLSTSYAPLKLVQTSFQVYNLSRSCPPLLSRTRWNKHMTINLQDAPIHHPQQHYLVLQTSLFGYQYFYYPSLPRLCPSMNHQAVYQQCNWTNLWFLDPNMLLNLEQYAGEIFIKKHLRDTFTKTLCDEVTWLLN